MDSVVFVAFVQHLDSGIRGGISGLLQILARIGYTQCRGPQFSVLCGRLSLATQFTYVSACRVRASACFILPLLSPR